MCRANTTLIVACKMEFVNGEILYQSGVVRDIIDMMRTNWIFRLIVAILLLLSSGGALAGCDGDCHRDDCYDGGGSCYHICRCATVHAHSIEYTPTITSVGTTHTTYPTQLAITDIFRPPNTIA